MVNMGCAEPISDDPIIRQHKLLVRLDSQRGESPFSEVFN